MNKHINNTDSGGPLVVIYCTMNTLLGPLQLSLNVKYINRSINRYHYRYTSLYSYIYRSNLYCSLV